jgi:hypothetical protein
MKLHIIISLLVLFAISACKKNRVHPVPLVLTDVNIDINLPSYNDLNGVGGYTFVNGGSKGIIVYRRSFDEFIAFDRHSPADPDGLCERPLTPQEDNFLQLEDTCNNALFSLYDGAPIQGSDYGLRLFQTVWDGNSKLRIYN